MSLYILRGEHKRGEMEKERMETNKGTKKNRDPLDGPLRELINDYKLSVLNM